MIGGADATYTTLYDSGTTTITANGHADTVSWSGSGTTTSTIASALASAINADSGAYVSASISGSTVNLTATTAGASTDYSLSSSSSYDSTDFSSASFSSSNSGSTLTGGHDTGGTTYDSGTVTVTINGNSDSASYGQVSTTSSIAQALASAIDSDSGASVTAAASGNNISLISKTTGSSANYSVSVSSQSNDSSQFSSPSFGLSAPSSMTGGSNASSSAAITQYAYDVLNDLLSVTQQGGADSSQWRIRSFNYNSLGQLSLSQNPESGNISYSYDADGNVLNDYLNTYSWDGYGRPVVVNGVDVTSDALGRMVEVNNGGTYTEFQYSPNGFKMQDMNGQTGLRAFVPLPGGAMAVWGPDYYRHSDWLGSGRFASSFTGGQMVYDLAYGPFGEPYAQAGTAVPNFTGMNQDVSSNVYDFPAREYGIQGRWPLPDPAGIAAVNLMDPQTWNRYAYVRNSPLELVDPSGLGQCPQGVHCPPPPPPPSDCNTDGVTGPCSIVLGGADVSDLLDLLSTPLGYYWQDTGLRVPGTDIAVEELVTVYPNMDDVFQLLDLLEPGVPITNPVTIGPLKGKDKLIARIQCAADYADQNSLASHAAAGGNAGEGAPAPNFLENLFLGNPFSGLTDLGLDVFANRTPSGSEIATTLLSGGRQGMPGGGAGSKGAVGVVQDAALAKLGGKVAVEVGDGIGSAMLAYHLASFINGAANVCSDY